MKLIEVKDARLAIEDRIIAICHNLKTSSYKSEEKFIELNLLHSLKDSVFRDWNFEDKTPKKD